MKKKEYRIIACVMALLVMLGVIAIMLRGCRNDDSNLSTVMLWSDSEETSEDESEDGIGSNANCIYAIPDGVSTVEIDTDGDGVPETWTVIRTKKDFPSERVANSRYILANDIDCGGVTLERAIKLGTGSFLEGNGCIISGFSTKDEEGKGIYGAFQLGGSELITVRNLQLGTADSPIEMDNAVVARDDSVSFTSYWKDVDVHARFTKETFADNNSRATGVFFSSAQGDHTFEDCDVFVYSCASTNENARIGGFVGDTRESTSTLTFINCTANGSISCKAKVVGGMMGYVNPSFVTNITMTNCKANMTIKNSGEFAGGLIAWVNGNEQKGHPTVTLKDCEKTATVSGAHKDSKDALIGYMKSNNIYIISEKTSKNNPNAIYKIPEGALVVELDTDKDGKKEAWKVIRSMEDFPSDRVGNSRYILANDINCGGATLQRAIKLGAGAILEGNNCKILNFCTKDIDGKGIYGAFWLGGPAPITVRNLQLGTAKAPIKMDNAVVARDDSASFTTYWKNVDVHAEFTKKTFADNKSRATGVFFSTAQGAHTFEDCDVYVYSCASTNENARIGGFVGDTKEATVSLTFKNCTANGNISCKAKTVGGMIGYINPSAKTKVQMTNCKANLSIKNTGEFAGGVIGWANGSKDKYPVITLENCEKTVSVSGASTKNKDRLIGYNTTANSTTITPSESGASNIPSNPNAIYVIPNGVGMVDIDTDGDGTKETWTVIRCIDDFPSDRIGNSRYILANDIDCKGTTLERAIKLGAGSIFEGNGCKILNFSTKDEAGKGIYGAFQLGGPAQIIVRNLQLGTAEAPIEMDNAVVARDDGAIFTSYWKDVDVHAKFTKETFANNNSRATGVFFSTAQGAHTFEDCDVYVYSCASTNENARIGGFVGDTKETTVSLTFINCTTNGDISCKAKAVGGMVGYINPSATTTVTITNCKANMTITNSGEFAGGLIGWANGSAGKYPSITIENCEKTVTVSGASANNKDKFIGYNTTTGSTTITPDEDENTGGESGDGGNSGDSGDTGEIPENPNVIYPIPAGVTTVDIDTDGDGVAETWTVIRSMSDFPSERVGNSRYILANDIDCSGATLERAIKLGAGAIFEGNGCKILNFSTKDEEGKGIYGAFQLGGPAEITVRNLQLGTAEAPIEMDNAIVARDDSASYTSYWKNVDVHARFTKETFANNNSRATGVFFSTAQGDHTFEDCDVYVHSCASTNENARIGGFVGDTKEATVSLTFINCTTNGTISCKAKAVGGLIGFVNQSATTTVSMMNCEANMTITNSGEFAGGLIGWANGAANKYPSITLAGCEKTATVSGASANNQDAFIGYNKTTSSTKMMLYAIPENVTTVDIDTDGDGVAETWTVIRSMADFPSERVANSRYILANDIDCGGVTLQRAIKLGQGSIFEGNACKILNFSTKDVDGEGVYGAFQLQGTAQITVRNLQLGTAEAPIEMDNAIVARDDSTSFTSYWKNVDVHAKFTKETFANNNSRATGVFFSTAQGTHTFEDCDVYVYSCASTNENARIGGFVGDTKKETVSLTFINCTANGNISCKAKAVGGMIGFVNQSATTTVSMTNCKANMSITNSGEFAGGLIGWANGAKDEYPSITLENCEKTATVTGASANNQDELIGYNKTTGSTNIILLAVNMVRSLLRRYNLSL